MADHPDDKASAVPVAAPVETSLGEQIATIRLALTASPVRKQLLWACLGIVAVIVATAVGQVLLNRWNQPFYDALARRDMQDFLHQLMVFAAIAGGLLVLNVGQTWLNQMIRLKLREALTLDLIDEWLRPARAFRLAHAGAIGVNPDQRMQQDAGHLADLSTDLGVGLLQSFILLASFIGVLWSLSSGFVFHFGDHAVAIPGYMVWAAILYAGIASWLSWLVGRPLIRLNSDRYTREAELRSSMVRVNENVDAIALAHGETDAKRQLQLDLGTVLGAMRRIYGAQINLAWVTDTYGWITVVAPILVASPVYFAGDISFEPKAVETEAGVVMSEAAMRGGPSRRAGMAELQFELGDPRASALPGGETGMVLHPTAADLRRFYQAYYQPDRAILTVVGDVDPDQLEAQIADRFQDWKVPRCFVPAMPSSMTISHLIN